MKKVYTKEEDHTGTNGGRTLTEGRKKRKTKTKKKQSLRICCGDAYDFIHITYLHAGTVVHSESVNISFCVDLLISISSANKRRERESEREGNRLEKGERSHH